MRRIVAILTIGAGLALIVFTFASSAFVRTHDSQVIADRFQVATSPAGFAAFKANVGETLAGTSDLTTKAYPQFAQAFGMTTPRFKAYVAAHYNDVSRGVTTLNGVPAFTGPVVNGVARLPHGFAPAYALPVKGLPISSVPWILLGLGGGLVLLGGLLWWRPGRGVTIAALVAGIAMVAVPFALDLPSKVSDVGKMVTLANYGLSADAATGSERLVYDSDGMIRQLNTELLPDVAARQHISQAELNRRLATQAPALAKLLQDWPAMVPGNYAFAADIRTSVGQWSSASKFPFEATPWLVIALGGMLVVFAGAALLPGRQPVARTAGAGV